MQVQGVGNCLFCIGAMGVEVRAAEGSAISQEHQADCDTANSNGANGHVPRLQVNTLLSGRPSLDPAYGGNRTTRSRLRSEPFFIGVAGMLFRACDVDCQCSA